MSESAKLNIILVEDDYWQREKLLGLVLDRDFGHQVIAFRDLDSLQLADTASIRFTDTGRPMVVILDIMLAKCLMEGERIAKRWPGPGLPPKGQRRHYVDDMLGIEIGQMVRRGEFKCIPQHTPLLFVSARTNSAIKEIVSNLQPATCLEKPIAAKVVSDAAVGLCATAAVATHR